VLGSFVPFDAGVDEAVLNAPSVKRYLVLNARIAGVLGSKSLWNRSDWRAIPQPDVFRWMITRHDVWIPADGPDTLSQHGEAWQFHKQ
jgi:hypothetical protein